jgi:aryl-alcohol dehydrogenase-like predicted oxidoreductase
MKYNLLGTTGLKVSELCLGTMTFGGKGRFLAIGTLGQAQVDQLTKRAIDGGINFIDTANVYSEGWSEELTGQSIRNLGLHRDDLIIATKVRGKMGEGPNDSGLTRKHIIQQVEASLRRLQIDYIDLYQIHSYDPLTPFGETLSALDHLVQAGKVRYIGASNVAAWQLMKALDYSYCRDKEKEADGRRANFDFPPINKERAFDIIDLLQPMAKAKNTSVAGLALAWLLQKPYVTSVIIGANKMDQLEDNLKSIDLRFSSEELEQLDKASALTREYPGWMLEFTGADRKA